MNQERKMAIRNALRVIIVGVLASTATITASAASVGPPRGGVQVNPTQGLARPTNLVVVSTAGDCPKLGMAVADFCASAMKDGYLLVHWDWKKSPCGYGTCLDEDLFRLVHKSGGAGTTTDWYYHLANFPKGTWKNGDCFIVRAHNSAVNLDSADSTQTCVGLTLIPVPNSKAVISH
jgi:hypothetical protein